MSSSDHMMYALEQKSDVNRTRVEILANILQVASNRTLKTHIMYRANLSHRQLEKYLSFLETNGMLEQLLDEDGVMKFHVTQKGIDFLKDYQRLSSYLPWSLSILRAMDTEAVHCRWKLTCSCQAGAGAALIIDNCSRTNLHNCLFVAIYSNVLGKLTVSEWVIQRNTSGNIAIGSK